QYCICFFFQAEDGIRDATVTGVQTCALPIWIFPDGSWSNRNGPVPRHDLRRHDLSPRRAIRRDGRVATAGFRGAGHLERARLAEIGRASCRERGEVKGVEGGGRTRNK